MSLRMVHLFLLDCRFGIYFWHLIKCTIYNHKYEQHLSTIYLGTDLASLEAPSKSNKSLVELDLFVAVL